MAGRGPAKTDPRQGNLDLKFFPVPQTPAPARGSADISTAVRETIAESLAAARQHSGGERDRYTIAADISRLGGRDCTKNMLDRYCAPSADEWRFPLEMLPAFVQATGDFSLLDRIAEACGCKVLRGEEAWIAEYAALLVQEAELKQRLSAFKKHMPGNVLERLEAEARKRAEGGG